MGTNGFREDEFVSRKVKVGNEWQTKTFPIIGGRLRIIHETNSRLSIQTKIVRLDNDFVVVRAAVQCERGKFNGTGIASFQRDARLADSLVELAESRAIARALRFDGYGLEYCGAEEVCHVTGVEPEREQTTGKESDKVFTVSQGNSELEAKTANGGPVPNPGKATGAQDCAAADGSKPQSCGNGRATSAQSRALWSLTKKARYTEEDIESLLRPLKASTFQDPPEKTHLV